AHILDQPKQEQQLRYSLEFIHQNVNNPEKSAFFL
ncbi:Rgg/GadR/MutR family transcriptional regulator, partial [Lacticaseibacillus paracasei]